MKKLLFVYNPKSGKGKIKKALENILKKFEKNGYKSDVYATKAPLDGKTYVIEHSKNYNLIVCAGGDGTINEIACGIIEAKNNTTLGIIPCGSTNDFGNTLGIPKDMLKAANIATLNNTQKIDIGQFNENKFVYVAAFGAFTDVSYSTPQKMKNIFGHLAYLIYGLFSIFSIRSQKININYKINNEYKELSGKFLLGAISNARYIGGFKNILNEKVNLTDGLFEVTLIKKISSISDIINIIKLVAGQKSIFNNIIKFQTSEATFKSENKIKWTIDGEKGPYVDFAKIKNLKQLININVK